MYLILSIIATSCVFGLYRKSEFVSFKDSHGIVETDHSTDHDVFWGKTKDGKFVLFRRDEIIFQEK